MAHTSQWPIPPKFPLYILLWLSELAVTVATPLRLSLNSLVAWSLIKKYTGIQSNRRYESKWWYFHLNLCSLSLQFFYLFNSLQFYSQRIKSKSGTLHKYSSIMENAFCGKKKLNFLIIASCISNFPSLYVLIKSIWWSNTEAWHWQNVKNQIKVCVEFAGQ